MLAGASEKRAILLLYPPVYCELVSVDAASCTKKTEDQLRTTTREHRARITKCTEVYGGILEHLL